MAMIKFTDLPRAAITRAFFFSGLTIEDVRKEVTGELPDLTYLDPRSGHEFTFTYGNSELIVSVDSDDENSRIFYAESMNSTDYYLIED